MVFETLERLTKALSVKTFEHNRGFDDVVAALRSAGEPISIALDKEKREAGETATLTINFTDGSIRIMVFYNQHFFAVRRSWVVENGTSGGFRWNKDEALFHYPGSTAKKQILFRFLTEVLKDF